MRMPEPRFESVDGEGCYFVAGEPCCHAATCRTCGGEGCWRLVELEGAEAVDEALRYGLDVSACRVLSEAAE